MGNSKYIPLLTQHLSCRARAVQLLRRTAHDARAAVPARSRCTFFACAGIVQTSSPICMRGGWRGTVKGSSNVIHLQHLELIGKTAAML